LDAGATDAGPVVEAADYFIATDGSDSNPGTMAQPFATFAAADAVVAPGELVYVRGGTYTEPAELGASGRVGERYEGYPGERVLLQGPGRDHPFQPQVLIAGDHVEVRRMVIADAASYGVLATGNGVTVQELSVRQSGRVGILFYHAAGGTISRCLAFASYDKFDSDGSLSHGQDGDGISISGGSDGLIEDCVSWGNSDDGFDVWNSSTTTIRGSFAFENGVDRWSDSAFEGNGNGFKLGSGTSRDITALRNVSFNNQSRGFDSNGNQDSRLAHCTSSGDRYGFSNRHASNVWNNSVGYDASAAIVQENLDSPRSNAWDLSIVVDAAAFVSTSAPTFTGDEEFLEVWTALSRSDFLRPAPGGPLVDVGEDLGEPFSGSAPDLGAYEAP